MYLDLSKLRTLEAVHLLGSMTAAASALGYTTGAVSQQMSSLERSLTMVLFEKVGRRMQLTDAGMVLFEYAGQLLSLEREAHDALRATDSALIAHVRIGVFGTAAAELLPHALKTLREKHEGLTVHSVEVDVDAATSAVESGAVHMAFGVDYADAPIPRRQNVELRPLRNERFEVAFSAQRQPIKGPVSLRDFADQGWILPPADTQYGLAMRHACRRAGFEPVVEHEVTDTASSLAMVAGNLGIAPVTPLMLALRGKDIHTVALREDIRRELVLAFRSKPEPGRGLKTVIDVISESVAVS